jgi:hypothetical protein
MDIIKLPSSLSRSCVRYASVDCNMMPCNCNWYCAYANGFIVLAEDLGVDIQRALLHALVVVAGEHYVRINVQGLNPECVCRIAQSFL